MFSLGGGEQFELTNRVGDSHICQSVHHHRWYWTDCLTQGGHDEFQCDAREAGLKRLLKMDDRSSRLGDHGRYAAQSKMPRLIKLNPVREDDAENFTDVWRRRSQILGSILHWAHEAGASNVSFDPALPDPLTYSTAEGHAVPSTELGPTPARYKTLIAPLLRNTIEGQPALMRSIRRVIRRILDSPATATIEIPSTKLYGGTTWTCEMQGDKATFTKLATTPPLRNA